MSVQPKRGRAVLFCNVDPEDGTQADDRTVPPFWRALPSLALPLVLPPDPSTVVRAPCLPQPQVALRANPWPAGLRMQVHKAEPVPDGYKKLGMNIWVH